MERKIEYYNLDMILSVGYRVKSEQGIRFRRWANETLKKDLLKHSTLYPPIVMTQNKNIHDRFLIVDEDVYHIGASLKDLGKKLFAFSKMNVTPSVLIQ